MPWQKGQSGNPGGRPRGARDKLSKAVMEQLLDDWNEHGIAVIERVRENKPEVYLQFVGRALPQGVELDVTDGRRSISEYTSAELASLLDKPKKKAS